MNPAKQLIWLCHSIKKPVGGVKVIYRQAQLTNELLAPWGHSAAVMHPNTWRFRVKWFDNTVPIRRGFFKWRWTGKPSLSRIDGCFDPERHRVVVPELWARKYGDQLARMGVPYAIYVQGGYLISKGEPSVLDEAYQGATCIMTISEDTTRCVTMAFPGTEHKILRVHAAVDAQRFNPHRAKENLITYMPRKLEDHSTKVLFLLRHHLPAHWRVEAVNGLSEAGVADLLQRSKIFMSFSHFEGFGLPPLEAALCGNQVIGYTGQGAKEYWLSDVFEAVESGDVVSFAQRVLGKIKQLDQASSFPLRAATIDRLSTIYSASQEKAEMQDLIQRMQLKKF